MSKSLSRAAVRNVQLLGTNSAYDIVEDWRGRRHFYCKKFNNCVLFYMANSFFQPNSLLYVCVWSNSYHWKCGVERLEKMGSDEWHKRFKKFCEVPQALRNEMTKTNCFFKKLFFFLLNIIFLTQITSNKREKFNDLSLKVWDNNCFANISWFINISFE